MLGTLENENNSNREHLRTNAAFFFPLFKLFFENSVVLIR